MLLNCSIAKRAVLAVLQLSAKTESDESILHTAFYNITRTRAQNVYMYYRHRQNLTASRLLGVLRLLKCHSKSHLGISTRKQRTVVAVFLSPRTADRPSLCTRGTCERPFYFQRTGAALRARACVEIALLAAWPTRLRAGTALKPR